MCIIIIYSYLELVKTCRSMFFLDSLCAIILRVYIRKGPTRRNLPSLRYSPERLIEDCLYWTDISFSLNILQFRINPYVITKFSVKIMMTVLYSLNIYLTYIVSQKFGAATHFARATGVWFKKKNGPDNKHHSRHRCVVTLNKMHYSLCAVWNLCCQNSLQRRGRVGSPSIPTEFAK